MNIEDCLTAIINENIQLRKRVETLELQMKYVKGVIANKLNVGIMT